MMLRTRVTVIVSLSFVLLTLGLILESLRQQRAVEARQAAAIISGDKNTWLGLLAAESQRLEGLVEPLTRDEGLVLAVASADPAGVTAALERQLRTVLADPAEPLRVEVTGPTGDRLFATTIAGEEPPLLGPGLLEVLQGPSSTVSGLIARPGRGPVIAAVAPLYGRRGLTGYVILYTAPEPLLAKLAQAIGADTLLLPVEGEVAGEGAEPARAPGAEQEPGLARVSAEDGRILLRVHAPLEDRFGRPAGALVSLRDITAADREERIVRMLSYGAIVCVLLLLAGVLHWYLRMAFRPLNSVIGILAALARGRSAAPVEGPFREDEIGSLASTVEAFRRARQALVEARAAQARIDSELAVARRIQLDIVPSAALPPGGLENIQLAAVLEPAKEVGGDLYDFFLLDDGRLFLIVGDVSGKGVPSALVMVIVRTLVRIVARAEHLSLPEIMAAVNRFLAENNPHQMFVTAFAGILDPSTGAMTCCDAGHPPPLIRRADGRVEELAKRCGLPLGILPDYVFTSSRLQLDPGDTLIVYSDGISEAMNEEDALFSTERIETGLAALPPDAPASEITQTLLEEVRAFAGRAPQSDDITLLVLRWLGAEAAHRQEAA